MIQLNLELLAELGLGELPEAVANDLLRHAYETLELRVGEALAEEMTEAQLDEFEAFVDTEDEAGAFKWLQANFPDYKEVVAKQFEGLKVEIAASAEAILAAARADS